MAPAGRRAPGDEQDSQGGGAERSHGGQCSAGTAGPLVRGASAVRGPRSGPGSTICLECAQAVRGLHPAASSASRRTPEPRIHGPAMVSSTMRIFRYAVLALALAALPACSRRPRRGSRCAAAQPIVVYKTATCGCCTKWVDHLKAAGFAPTVHTPQTMDEAPMRKRHPGALRSCHTATLEGYLVEGHVPADVIQQAAEGEAARGRDCGAGDAGRIAGNGIQPTRSPTTSSRSTRPARRRCSRRGRWPASAASFQQTGNRPLLSAAD